jgi:predicted ATP-dependent endonuclease of OLD family
MIINRIKLENFTVFTNVKIDFDHGINIFIGENGTGKTHLLKVLYSACQCTDPKISFPYKIVSVMLPDDYNISRLISRRQGNPKASVRVTAIDELQDSPKNKLLTAGFCEKNSKWNADVTGEHTWEAAFKGTSSIFIPAKEILSNSYNLNAAVEKNNVRFDATYTDIINAAKIDISVGRNSTAKNKMLSRIQKSRTTSEVKLYGLLNAGQIPKKVF